MSACPSSDRLVEFLSGRLSEAEQRTVEEHVNGCPTCRGSLARLAKGTGVVLSESLTNDTDHDQGADSGGRRRFVERLKKNAPPQP